MFPSKALLPCEYCPVGTSYTPEIASCRECKTFLYVTCPHDGIDMGRCSMCTDRIFSESKTCTLHLRKMHYFCLDCVSGVCECCLFPSENHGGHRFQKLGALYSTKMNQVLRMMSNLSISIGNTNVVKKQIAKNLELVEINEQELLADLEALFKTAKESIQASANRRKNALKEKLAVDFATPRDLVEKEIFSLSKYELIKHQPALIQLITQQMASCVGFSYNEVDSYGFECPLIPQMSFANVRIDNITKRKVPVQIAVVDSSGFPWTAMIAVYPTISVQLFPKDEYLECFQHRVVFEIVHRDLTKTLRRSFTKYRCEEMPLVDVQFLRVNGFLLQDNVIVMRIGIRASSLIVENEMLKLQQYKQHEAVLEREEESSEQNVCCSSFFHLPLAENEEDSSSSVRIFRIESDPITDAFGHKWCLRIKRVARNVRSNKTRTMLGVYIVQLDGVRCRCKYFIILHNKDPSKRMYTSGEEEFSAMDQNFGRNACIDVADLTEMSGFVFDGTLRFQFGVTPITSNGTVIEVAHITESNQLVTKTILK